ncbi:MAG: methyl-accepting chemotaxis protein [Lachnospiraceae bacterium]|nr:methyl-accepting chemotaxis protein [Lachnospiraceae bacterium]
MKQLNKLNSIATRLVSGFMVVIILIIALGVVSYNGSSSTMLNSYKQNMAGTVNTTATYLELGMSQVSSEAQKIIDNSDFYNYYRGAYRNDKPHEYMLWSSLYNIVQSAASASEFIMAISVFGSYGDGISSAGDIETGFYNTFKDTVPENTEDGIWISSHNELDVQLHIEKDRYAVSYVRSFTNFDGYIVIDINAKSVTNVLKNLELDEKSIIGYVSPDGSEILNTGKDENVFSGQDFYKEAVSGGPDLSMVKYNNQKYLFTFSNIADTGSSVCCLVPQKVMLSQAYEIRNMTIAITITAIIIAFFIALFLALNIHKAINTSIAVLEKAAGGDLTGTVRMKRKDEFGVLGTSINSMISNMKVLLEKVDQVSSLVQSSSDNVTQTSELLVSPSDEICNAISEIESGTSSQAAEAERCLEQMADLSDKINILTTNTSAIETISHDTKVYAGQGIDIIDKLNKRSKDTQEVTEAVIDGISKLNEETNTIENIVEVISSISDQTSLLSLNASIEAARAGESGKGFAVVADEIRKLADESMQAVSRISDIITRINTQTELTVETARRAEQIVGAQQDALVTTVSLFNTINKHIEDLADNLDDITKGIEQMSVAKDHTLSAIQSISDVSDRAAASTSQVFSTIVNQMDAVKNLNGNAETLNNNSRDLMDAVTQFKLN